MQIAYGALRFAFAEAASAAGAHDLEEIKEAPFGHSGLWLLIECQ